MNSRLPLFLLALFFSAHVFAQDKAKVLPEWTERWDPVPVVITPGSASTAPSDAVVLFDGSDLSKWQKANGEPAGWKIEEGAMVVEPRTGGIQTKQGFGDVQLHIEWRTPAKVKGEGQGRGNSGIFLMGQYELQVLDSYQNTTYPNGQAGSIYKQHIPLVNASKGPGEWQTYDIIFTSPVFNEQGGVKSPARVTVLHNGVLVQNNVSLIGPTEYIGVPQYKAHADKLPLALQDHGNPVAFRNIWVREL